LGGVFFRTDIENVALNRDGELSEESGLADARLTGKKINATAGEAGTEDAIELTDACRKGVAFLRGEGLLDGESFGGFGGGFSGTTPLGLKERSSLDKGVPLMAGGALAGPFGKLVATAVAEKNGG